MISPYASTESNRRHPVWEPVRHFKRPRATCEISRQPFDKGRNTSDRFLGCAVPLPKAHMHRDLLRVPPKRD
jgi:hypothetical protein